MNSRRLGLAVAAALAIALAFAIGWMRFTAAPQGNLSGASIGGPFTLIDQDGRPASERDFAGKYRLMYFGYTFCPDVCPTDVALIARGVKAFEMAQPARAALVQPIFITVDPERDDPKSLKAFVRAFSPKFIGLTGTPAQIDKVKQEYGIYSRKVPTSDPANYLVDHLAVIYLFGPDGQPIAFLPHGSTAADVTAMLETYVR